MQAISKLNDDIPDLLKDRRFGLIAESALRITVRDRLEKADFGIVCKLVASVEERSSASPLRIASSLASAARALQQIGFISGNILSVSADGSERIIGLLSGRWPNLFPIDGNGGLTASGAIIFLYLAIYNDGFFSNSSGPIGAAMEESRKDHLLTKNSIGHNTSYRRIGPWLKSLSPAARFECAINCFTTLFERCVQ